MQCSHRLEVLACKCPSELELVVGIVVPPTSFVVSEHPVSSSFAASS